MYSTVRTFINPAGGRLGAYRLHRNRSYRMTRQNKHWFTRLAGDLFVDFFIFIFIMIRSRFSLAVCLFFYLYFPRFNYDSSRCRRQKPEYKYFSAPNKQTHLAITTSFSIGEEITSRMYQDNCCASQWSLFVSSYRKLVTNKIHDNFCGVLQNRRTSEGWRKTISAVTCMKLDWMFEARLNVWSLSWEVFWCLHTEHSWLWESRSLLTFPIRPAQSRAYQFLLIHSRDEWFAEQFKNQLKRKLCTEYTAYTKHNEARHGEQWNAPNGLIISKTEYTQRLSGCANVTLTLLELADFRTSSVRFIHMPCGTFVYIVHRTQNHERQTDRREEVNKRRIF